MFHIGQKVVCIHDIIDRLRVKNWPIKGQIYTIRGFRQWPDELGLYLEEIHNSPDQWSDGIYEVVFNSFRFRPIIERKTDISVFTALLNPKKVEEVV